MFPNLRIMRLVMMNNIKDIMETSVTIKKGTLFLWGLTGFGCGVVFMFFVVLFAVV